MANGTLSSYFEKLKDKGVKTEGVSPYSASVEPTGGYAPSGGGPAGGPSASKAAPARSAGGGTGFVSFGQYFGANAPAIQQQAQGVVGKVSEQRPVQQGAPSLGMARLPAGSQRSSAGLMAQRQAAGPSAKDPYAAQIAETSAQFAALNPAAQSGDMGEGVSAFDQLLGGGVTQRAAKQEQQRLNMLRGYLQTEQNKYQSDLAAEQRIQEQGQREQDAYKAWYADLPQAYKDNYTPEELLAIYEQEGGAKVSGMVSTSGSSL